MKITVNYDQHVGLKEKLTVNHTGVLSVSDGHGVVEAVCMAKGVSQLVWCFGLLTNVVALECKSSLCWRSFWALCPKVWRQPVFLSEVIRSQSFLSRM